MSDIKVKQFCKSSGLEPEQQPHRFGHCAMPPVEPKALPTHLPVFPGCQSLSRHLSDGVKRPVPLCHRHSPAGNPCAIVALLALGSSSQKRGLRVAGDSNPCAYLQTTANLSHFVVHFLSPPRTGYSIGAPPFCSMFTYRRMIASAPSYVWVCITSRIICPATNSA